MIAEMKIRGRMRFDFRLTVVRHPIFNDGDDVGMKIMILMSGDIVDAVFEDQLKRRMTAYVGQFPGLKAFLIDV